MYSLYVPAAATNTKRHFLFRNKWKKLHSFYQQPLDAKKQQRKYSPQEKNLKYL